MVMNLILNTDVNATNKKLEKYQRANNHFVDKGLKDATGQKPKKRAVDDSVADPSGLIQGLRKIVAPVRIPDYDAFEGMHAAYDYFTLKEEYQEHWTKAGISSSALAGGFDFQVSRTTLSFPLECLLTCMFRRQPKKPYSRRSLAWASSSRTRKLRL
jgi:hypothetical protein